MKVILTGGGTGGSITPLLAIKDKLEQKESCQFLFVGTKKGPEKAFAEDRNIPFKSVTAGKVRRYLDLRNLIDPIRVFIGLFQSLRIVYQFKPNVILTAGSFVAVPVVWAGWILRIPSLVHQQDLLKGLANKLMAPFAKKITVTFPSSLHHFSQKKTVLTGNPVRPEIYKGSAENGIKIFNLDQSLPTVLILGGGTGALAINKIVSCSFPILKFCQVIHVAGKGKNIFQDKQLSDLHRPNSISEVISKKNKEQKDSLLSRYHLYEFLSEELPDAYAVAELVITRAGMSTLSELAVLAKPTIIIPIPDSHQEKNARYFEQRAAAHVLSQKTLTPEIFTATVKQLVANQSKLKEMSKNAKKLFKEKATDTIITEIMKIKK